MFVRLSKARAPGGCDSGSAGRHKDEALESWPISRSDTRLSSNKWLAAQPAHTAFLHDILVLTNDASLRRTLECGSTWQAEYRDMHAAMLRGDIPPRYLVANGVNGLADSLTGATTMFYLAVLQNRAFKMTFGVADVDYGAAFTQPNVNWTW